MLKCHLALASDLKDVVSRCCVVLLDLHTVTPLRAVFAFAVWGDTACRLGVFSQAAGAASDLQWIVTSSFHLTDS